MFMELRLSRIRKQQQIKLNEKNRSVYNDIKEYLTNSSLVRFQREEVLQQILDIMLQAQEEGKDINLFLGQDHKKFCDSIINEFNSTNSYLLKTISFIEQLFIYIIIGIFLDMIFWSAPIFKVSTIINMVFFFLIFNPMSRKSVKERIYPTNKKVLSTGMVFIVYFILYIITSQIIYKIGSMNGLDLIHVQISLFSIKYPIIISIIFVIVSEIYKALNNKQKVVM